MKRAENELLYAELSHARKCLPQNCNYKQSWRFQFKNFSRIFRHLICFQALLRALNLSQKAEKAFAADGVCAQAFSRTSQACCQLCFYASLHNAEVSGW